jgi:hypothetical protein
MWSIVLVVAWLLLLLDLLMLLVLFCGDAWLTLPMASSAAAASNRRDEDCSNVPPKFHINR